MMRAACVHVLTFTQIVVHVRCRVPHFAFTVTAI